MPNVGRTEKKWTLAAEVLKWENLLTENNRSLHGHIVYGLLLTVRIHLHCRGVGPGQRSSS